MGSSEDFITQVIRVFLSHIGSQSLILDAWLSSMENREKNDEDKTPVNASFMDIIDAVVKDAEKKSAPKKVAKKS